VEQTPTTAEAAEPAEDGDLDSVKIEWSECAPPPTFPATRRRGRRLLIFASLLGAFVLGTIWHFAGTFLDLIFLTPLAAGLGLAYVMGKAVSWAHWRRPQTVIWLSIAATLLIFTTRYVEDCVSVRSQLVLITTEHYAEKWHMPADAAQSNVEQGLTPFRRIVVNRTTQGEESYLLHATITPEAASTIRTTVRRLI
jgi:hypothetical protein